MATDGTVTVTMPGGVERVFQPDSRGFDYFSQPGDYGVLAHNGSGYTLRESNGQIEFFNGDGTLGYIQDINGNRITAGYDPSGQLTSLTSYSATSLIVPVSSLNIAYSSGLIQSVTSSDGRTVNYTYDTQDRLIQVQNYDGTLTQYGYDTSGHAAAADALTTIEFPDGTHQFFSYDAEGRLAGSWQDGDVDAYTYAYNLGQASVTDAGGDVAQIFYNEQGLPVKTIDPLGNVAYVTYDGNFNLTSATGPTGLVQSFTYDKNGNLTGVTNALGQTDSFSYTGPGNLLATSTDAQGSLTTYHYDSSGNLTLTQNPDGTVTSATYDALGDPLTIINQNGQVTNNTYDAAGQITGETLADGTAYAFTYDSHGNLITAVSAAGTITLYYDTGDRLTEVAYPNGQSLTFTYTGGRRTQMVDQAGKTVNYSYTATGELAELTDGNDNNAPIVTYVYNNLGQLVTAVDGSGTANPDGTYASPYTTYTYDKDGNLLQLVNYAGGTKISSSFDYTYNALGQVVTMATVDGTWTYSHDASGQLTHATLASTNPAIASQDLTYEYNAAGDRTQTIVNGSTTNYTSNSVNETTSTSDGAAYTYDADGNLVSKTDASGTTTAYTYDSLDRLTSVTSPTDSWIYEYDALGNLAATIHDGLANGQVTSKTTTQNLVDPTGLGNVVGQYDGSGNLFATYTYGLGLVSQVTPGGTNYYQFDGLGSTADLVNVAGAIQDTYAYLPFGGLLHPADSAANPFTFAGQFGVSSDGSGLLNMRARSYDPSTGQFVSNDPIGLLGGDVNVRRYVGNAVTSRVDPAGLKDSANGGKESDGFLGGTFNWLNGLNNLQRRKEELANCDGETQYGNQADQGLRDAQKVAGDTNGTQQDLQSIGNFLYNRNNSVRKLKPPPTNLSKAKDYIKDNTDMAKDAGKAAGNAANILGLLNSRKPKPSGKQGGTHGKTKSAKAKDPNALIGPAGYGPEAFVAPAAVLPYEIDFENSPDANTPAQQVTVSDPLDPSLDPSTFQITEIAFGNTVLTVDSQEYNKTVSMTDSNGNTFNVEITAGIDPATNTLLVTFVSVDPNTGMPPDPLIGFLPPEDGTGRGMGRIEYTIQAKPGLPTGTPIINVAQISFDKAPSIATDQVDDEDPTQGIDATKQALITIDADVPTTSVTLPATETSPTFPVNWTVQDVGSGVANCDIYVSEDSGKTYTLFTSSTSSGSAMFSGQDGYTYTFYSVAIDNVGNMQSTLSAPATTTVVSTYSTQTDVVSNCLSGSTYGQAVTFTATVGTGGAGIPTGTVQFLINGSGFDTPVTLSGGAASIVVNSLDVGTYQIDAIYTSDDPANFQNSQTTTSLTQVVMPAPLTVTATSEGMTYGGAVPALAYTYTGLVNGDKNASFTGALSTGATSSSGVGGYAIVVGSLAAGGNYTIGVFNPGILTVNAAALTVTATSEGMTYGGAVPALAYTYTGLVNGDKNASFTGALGHGRHLIQRRRRLRHRRGQPGGRRQLHHRRLQPGHFDGERGPVDGDGGRPSQNARAGKPSAYRQHHRLRSRPDAYEFRCRRQPILIHHGERKQHRGGLPDHRWTRQFDFHKLQFPVRQQCLIRDRRGRRDHRFAESAGDQRWRFRFRLRDGWRLELAADIGDCKWIRRHANRDRVRE